MNIYEMLDFIRKNDATNVYTAIADFLNDQYMRGRIEAEDLFYMYQEIMIAVVANLSYFKEPGV